MKEGARMGSPVSPAAWDFASLYEGAKEGQEVEFLDVGCGYGGLLGNFLLALDPP